MPLPLKSQHRIHSLTFPLLMRDYYNKTKKTGNSYAYYKLVTVTLEENIRSNSKKENGKNVSIHERLECPFLTSSPKMP